MATLYIISLHKACGDAMECGNGIQVLNSASLFPSFASSKHSRKLMPLMKEKIHV